MKRRIPFILLGCMFVLGVSGCGHEHTWKEADCSVPKTCVECGETEGEALGHNWKEANCSVPKTCVECGEIEGDALGHNWLEATCSTPKTCSVCGENEGEVLKHTLIDANYQQPATCTICGETEGEPLQATEFSIAKGAELDTVYDFEIPCYDDETQTTIAKIVFSNYQIFDSDDSHPAKEGYEWKTVDISFVVGDENAAVYGYLLGGIWVSDYYWADGWTDIEGGQKFIVNYYGIDYPECQYIYEFNNSLWTNEEKYGWPVTLTRSYKVSVLMPKDADGFMFGFSDAQSNFWDVEEEDDYWNQIASEDYIYFRFE
ncbi:MAG: hypothetical protein E7290_06050 [Lachnospiraceae bacterium]|nr:hypothetical protein [Lachnospiraceae bacterium]